jgi:hypothetical protein
MKKLYNSWIPKVLAVAIVVVGVGIQSQMVFALSLTSLSDNMSRLQASTASDHEIKFVTPAGGGVAAGQTLTFTFSADFDLATQTVAFGDIDFAEGTTNNCTSATFNEKTLAAAPSGATWGAAISGQVLTITSGTDTVTADRCIRLKIGDNATGGAGNNQIINGAADDDDTITIAGTFGDTGTISVDIITDDQVDITATVSPSITFSINATAIEFGTLTAADDTFADLSGGNATEVEAHQLAAGTNATSGYVMYVSGATLTSGGNSIDAIGASNTASAAGTEQFGVRYTASGGSGAVLAPYAASGFAYNGVSSPDDIASAAGPTATTTYSARYVGNITAVTEAGSYATTLTYTATATY